MNDEDLRSHIIERLSHAVPEDDIVKEVCELSGLSWYEAEALVKEAAWQDDAEVGRRQFPLLALLSMASVVPGLLLIGLYLDGVVQPLLVIMKTRGDPNPFDLGAEAWWMAMSAGQIEIVFIGGAMIVGGAIGLYKASGRLMK